MFKVGDIVTCISIPPGNRNNLTVGKTYTVTCVWPLDKDIMVDYNRYFNHSMHFISVQGFKKEDVPTAIDVLNI